MEKPENRKPCARKVTTEAEGWFAKKRALGKGMVKGSTMPPPQRCDVCRLRATVERLLAHIDQASPAHSEACEHARAMLTIAVCTRRCGRLRP